jgi:hypothetical protein
MPLSIINHPVARASPHGVVHTVDLATAMRSANHEKPKENKNTKHINPDPTITVSEITAEIP